MEELTVTTCLWRCVRNAYMTAFIFHHMKLIQCGYMFESRDFSSHSPVHSYLPPSSDCASVAHRHSDVSDTRQSRYTQREVHSMSERAREKMRQRERQHIRHLWLSNTIDTCESSKNPAYSVLWIYWHMRTKFFFHYTGFAHPPTHPTTHTTTHTTTQTHTCILILLPHNIYVYLS
jgi:hypothetical protein